MARFEVIEQEKEILEEEHQQSLAHGEELLIQLDQIKRARCTKCSASAATFQRPSKDTSGRGPEDLNSVIVEEAIESSISNIEMSKSEKSLQKPLKMAIKNMQDGQERTPSMT